MATKKQPVCAYHPNKKGTHTCKNCGKKICFDCVSVSFGNYVCEECDSDLNLPEKEAGGDDQPLKKKGKKKKKERKVPIQQPIPRNRKYTKHLATFFFIVFAASIVFSIWFLKNPPHGKISIYRVKYYPMKIKEMTVSNFIEGKGIAPDWKSLENELTSDSGYFVYFDNPETAGVKPVWYVNKSEVAYTINKDSQDLCNNELPKTTLFSGQGPKEEDILKYIYASSKR